MRLSGEYTLQYSTVHYYVFIYFKWTKGYSKYRKNGCRHSAREVYFRCTYVCVYVVCTVSKEVALNE